jgi:hypothetical protein
MLLQSSFFVKEHQFLTVISHYQIFIKETLKIDVKINILDDSRLKVKKSKKAVL